LNIKKFQYPLLDIFNLLRGEKIREKRRQIGGRDVFYFPDINTKI